MKRTPELVRAIPAGGSRNPIQERIPMLKKLSLTAALVAAGSRAAIPHTSLETKEAPVSASYKAVLGW
ncbi:hypothetical protein BMJ32_03785 [Sinorhizobium medicae]|nr:hypothetical protein BMJ32_03785 [Sinorhizobium medicae]PLU13281.1 hypothetical protein BMJ31_27000 [Sinorhizobium medicae]PLU33744.1 hypothetical protein BMJ26_23315 [Sinorhizobium medicae]PLU43408.1 hypothetical protein BMJ25_26735 [Sinorhizobium medicae]PLU52493.1 hypothetical protein BMJ23_24700 [Sinorhizobium medicae]